MKYRGGAKPDPAKSTLSEQALSLHESGNKYVEIGALLGLSESRRLGGIKASSLVHYAQRVRDCRNLYADHLKNGINDDTPLDAITISTRLANSFKNSSIRTIGEARKLTREEFLGIPNIGKVALHEWNEIISPIK